MDGGMDFERYALSHFEENAVAYSGAGSMESGAATALLSIRALCCGDSR